MSDVRPRIRLPREARAGEVVEVRTLVNHVMETGQRRDASGKLVPRQIINRFTCEYDGQMVLDVTLEPSISSNPYLEFDARVHRSGDFVFTWYEDGGAVHTQTHSFTVG